VVWRLNSVRGFVGEDDAILVEDVDILGIRTLDAADPLGDSAWDGEGEARIGYVVIRSIYPTAKGLEANEIKDLSCDVIGMPFRVPYIAKKVPKSF